MENYAESICTNLSREEVYKNFKAFSKDVQKSGSTLMSSAPIRLSGTKSLAAKRAYYTRLAYRTETKVASISLLMPPEICWASGYVPFNWEMFSSLLSSHSKVIELTNKGTAPVPRCSFINSLKGASSNGILPPPDISISSTAYCEGISHMFNELSGQFGNEHLHLDIPGYYSRSNLNNMSLQIQDAFKFLFRLNNISEKEAYKNFRKAMFYSALAKKEYLDICELRKNYAPLNLGLEPLHWHFLFTSIWGEESAYTICHKLKEEIQELINNNKTKPNNGLPISIFSLIPYGRTNIWDKMNEANAFTTFEGVNYIGDYCIPDLKRFEQLSERDLFDNLAYNLINSPMRGFNMAEKSLNFMKTVKDTGADGIVIFTHEHCQMLAPRLNDVEKAATDVGLKFVSISGDCILGMPPGPTSIRLGTFLTSLANKQEDEITQYSNRKKAPHTSSGNRVGIDFGSGFSKYVVLDKNNNLVKSDVLNSGIDYIHLLKEIKSKINLNGNLDLALSGIGGDNPTFKEVVQHQTTEINALIEAVKNICSDYNKFIVIDIGTQDVKVLKFNNINDNPWINTNKSCGAGTGMVLVQILERWQQSRPDISFDDLDQMALQAQKSELINTTCGIFAVTNVVSALIQSDDERRKEIILGVYQYIAEQALKLLPNDSLDVEGILLTGGVARHKSLRKIFKEKGYNLIPLPENIHPQFMVAYGTALSVH